MVEAPSSLTFETNGEAALESALDIINMLKSQNQQFRHVYMEIETNRSDQEGKQITRRRQTTHEDFTEDEKKQEEKDSKEKTKSVKRGTSHEKVLKTLFERTDAGPVPTKSVIEKTDLPEGTGYAAMSELYDRGLVERTEGSGQSYEYEVSQAGKEEIQRINSRKDGE